MTAEAEEEITVSRWSHSICEECWNKLFPDREATALKEEHREQATCCFCVEKHSSGIYVRYNPELTKCKGVHVIRDE